MEFSGANFSPNEFVPITPYVNYEDEVIYFSTRLVPSFMTKFDDIWTNTTDYVNYANVPSGPLVRQHPTFPISPELNFPPSDSYTNRLLPLLDAETSQIDVQVFRWTDDRPIDHLIKALQRGVTVHAYVDTVEYRNADRDRDAYNVDRLYTAGKQYPDLLTIRQVAHQDINHEKTVWLHDNQMSIFGTSNWSTASDDNQLESNIFTTDPQAWDELQAIFLRKWTNGAGFTESAPFVPLPPDKPTYSSPANGATNVAVTGTKLSFNGGHWAWNYDIFFGLTPDPGLLTNTGTSKGNLAQTFTLPTLQPGTTYYWKIRSYTEAGFFKDGPIYSFKTSGTAPPPTTCQDPSATNFGGPLPCVYSQPTGPTPFTGTPIALPGTIEAENYDLGGSGVAYHDTTTGNSSGAYRQDDVDIRNTTDTGGGYNIKSVRPGEWLIYTVSVANAGTYTLDVRSASSGGGGTVHVTLDGSTNLTGPMVLPNTGSWDVWATTTSSSFTLPSGTHRLMLSADVSGSTGTISDINWLAVHGSSQPPPPTLPEPWADKDIGAVPIAGSAQYSSGTFTLTGSGADIWGTADAFHYVYQPISGDATIQMRVNSIQNANSWSKAGAMIRETLSAGSAHAMIVASAAKGVAFQHRDSTGGISVSTAGSTSAPPRWVRLQRNGDLFTASESSDGSTWTVVGTDTIPMASSVFIGIPVTSHSTSATTTAVINSVAVTGGSQPPPPPTTLPAPWLDQDVGAVPIAGSAQYSNGTFTSTGSGADIWGTADAFHFIYQPVSGDATIQMRVKSVQNANSWSKTGAMIRETLSAGSAHAMLIVSAAKGVAFQRRDATGGVSVSTAGSSSAPPRWVRLERSGDLFTASESADGTTWSVVGTDTIAMAAAVYVGIPVTSHSTASTTAVIDSVTVSGSSQPPPPTAPPAPWVEADVGAVPIAGSTTYTNGTFTETGSGSDIWGTADAFHFLYEPVTGDGSIQSRVARVTNADRWSKAGVMVRETLDPGSPHAFMLVSSAKGVALQWRPTTGGDSLSVAGSSSTPPRWVRLDRSGNTITGSESSDGVNWTVVSTATIPMAPTFYVGLAVTSHTTSTSSTATISDVSTSFEAP